MAKTSTPKDRSNTRTTTTLDGATTTALQEGVAGSAQGIHIRSFPPTFRRAGIEFTSEGRNFRLDELSEEQLEMLVAEPMLSIVGVELPASLDDLLATDAKDDANSSGNEAGNA